jgi:thioredoxin 1
MAALRNATEQSVFDHVLGSSKIVVVDFFTPSCVLCKKIEPMLAAAGEKLGEQVEVVKVDAEANLEIAAKYDVRGVPTMLLIQQGEVRGRKTGFMTASALRDWISPFLK